MTENITQNKAKAISIDTAIKGAKITLYADAKANLDRYAITDMEGEPVMTNSYGNPRKQWIPKACVNNMSKDTVTVLADFVQREMESHDTIGAKYIWIKS